MGLWTYNRLLGNNSTRGVFGPITQVADRATRMGWSESPLRSLSSFFRSVPAGASLGNRVKYRTFLELFLDDRQTGNNPNEDRRDMIRALCSGFGADVAR